MLLAPPLQIDVMQARNNMSSITQAVQFGSPCERVACGADGLRSQNALGVSWSSAASPRHPGRPVLLPAQAMLLLHCCSTQCALSGGRFCPPFHAAAAALPHPSLLCTRSSQQRCFRGPPPLFTGPANSKAEEVTSASLLPVGRLSDH